MTYLKDKRTFAFHGKGNRLETIGIARKSEILITTEKGAQLMSSFSLPEPIDPTFYNIAPEIFNLHFHLDIYRISSFRIRVKRKSSYIFTSNSFDSIQRQQYLHLSRQDFSTSLKNTVNLPKMKVGDVVYIDYEYILDYARNERFIRSLRIFNHGLYPIKDGEIRIEYSSELPLAFNYVNNGEPNKSFGRDDIVDKWEFKNLPGALSEVNGRPYKSLPHTEWFIVGGTHRFPSFYRLNEYHLLEGQLSLKLGSTSKQFNILRSYRDSLLLDSFSNPDIQRAKSLFDDLALGFEYDNDLKFIEGERLLTQPKFGNNLIEKRLREMNKYEVYGNLIASMAIETGALFLTDNRVGSVSKFWMPSKYEGDFLLVAAFDNSKQLLLYPKGRQTGLFANELPFYFEGTKAEYVSVDRFTQDEWRNFYKKEIQLITLPFSEFEENQRRIYYEVDIKEDGTAQGTMNMQLTGQYSTVLRGLYMNEETPRFVNRNYTFRQGDQRYIRDFAFEFSPPRNYSPYNFSVTSSFSIDTKKRTNQILVPLDSLVLFSVEKIDTKKRTLPFYPDFLGEDKVTLKVNLPAGFTVSGLPKEISLEQDFGWFKVTRKLEGNSIVFSYSLAHKLQVVPLEQMAILKEMHDKAAEAGIFQLTLTKQD